MNATPMITANLALALAYNGPVKVFYSRDLPVVNLQALPRGLNANYLVCVRPHEKGGPLIAKAWKRREPKQLTANEILVVF